MAYRPIPTLRNAPRAVFAAAICVAVLLAAAPAAGQTIEDLMEKNLQLERMLEDVMREMRTLKEEVMQAATDSAAAKQAAESAAAAPEQGVASGNKNVSLTISGQVNRGVLYGDDGSNSDAYFVDNDASSTRVRFVGTGRVDDDFNVGAIVEIEMESNSTASVSQLSDRGADGTDFLSQRKLELFFDHERYGKVFLGQGDTASNGVAEVSLAGTDMVLYSGVVDMAGGLLFRREDGGPGVTGVSLSSPSVGSVFNQLDGLSRDDRIRYDTPSLYGVTLSASAIADGRWDVAGRYGAELGDTFAVQAAIAFAQQTDSVNILSGSGSVLHMPTGLSLT